MFTVSDLSAEEIEAIHSWVASGAQMADVQKRLISDLGHNVTYMDTRLISLDLGLEFQREEKSKPEAETPVEESAEVLPPAPSIDEVTVEVHQVTQPGAALSGSVTFSDGQAAQWIIDQSGRLSVDPDTPGYQPTEEDILKFQEKLREAVEPEG